MPKLSERLRAVADLVGEGRVLADVGTDHAYVPICLCQEGRIPRAIAMDLRRGPLERAEEHILQYGMQTYIETRLSDGVEALAPGEADAILIAGMGGGLVLHILENGQEVCRRAQELILQPQSELYRVRSYLKEHGYTVDAEEMVAEDGKYYPMMRVRWTGSGADTGKAADAPAADETGARCADVYGDALRRDAELAYGAGLLARRHPVLGEYLERERKNLVQIEGALAAQPQTGTVAGRRREIEYRLACNEAACSYYEHTYYARS